MIFLGAAFVSPGYSQEESRFYVATGCTLDETFEPDDEEPMDILHLPLAELPALLTPGESPIRNAQTLLALNWFLRLQDDLLG
jgi:hypothetical protein